MRKFGMAFLLIGILAFLGALTTFVLWYLQTGLLSDGIMSLLFSGLIVLSVIFIPVGILIMLVNRYLGKKPRSPVSVPVTHVMIEPTSKKVQKPKPVKKSTNKKTTVKKSVKKSSTPKTKRKKVKKKR
ncbi:hypothetical protein KO465_05380 [Candidatus Micrarchaeota archaeon]|jgi:hypothetical protein|nr:hypothetical protein [Candidatus Micrarchaeota archaeon]